jgi:MFS family permease
VPTLPTGTLAPLRFAPFRWLTAGRTVDSLGNAIAPVALAFAVLDLTGSPADLGVVVGARSFALAAFLLLGGVLADRLPRRWVLVGSNAVGAASQAVVAALVLTHVATVPLLIALSVVNGAAGALAYPASAALLPQTVPAEAQQRANALARLGLNGAAMAGAAGGGVLVAVVGPGWGLAVDAVSFVLAGACFAAVDLPGAVVAATGGMLAELHDGWQEFVARRWVWVVSLAFCAINAAESGGVQILGPVVADRTIGRAGWGLVLAAQIAGYLVGGLIALRLRVRRLLLTGVCGSATLVLPLVTLALLPHLVALIAAGFVAGVAVEQFVVAWDTSLQQEVPAERLARVYSYDALGSLVAVPLGQVAVGPLAGVVGVSPALLVCAAVIAVGVAFMLADPHIRSLRTPSPA